MHRIGRLVCIFTVAWVAPSTNAARAELFTGLGFLAGGFRSQGTAVSADGSIAVGSAQFQDESGHDGFRWTPAGGLVPLGALPGGVTSRFALGTSGDGSVVVGDQSSDLGSEAFRWENGTAVGLGDLPGGDTYSYGLAVSADGAIVVGRSASGLGGEGFRWTQGTGMVGLGDLAGGDYNSAAYGISSDGQTIVGSSVSGDGAEAFRWSLLGGMVGLGDLPGGVFFSEAYAASADGSVIVGRSSSSIFGHEAFRWTSGGGMVGLGFLPGSSDSLALDVSADGNIIVGMSHVGSFDKAFFWDPTNGMQDLQLFLSGHGANLSGWSLREATAVSADGTKIVGYGIHNGNYEAFYADLNAVPEPSSFLLVAAAAGGAWWKQRKHYRS